MPPMPSRSKLMSKCISLFQWSIGHMHVCVGWKGHVSFGKAIKGCPRRRPKVVRDHTTGTALHTCIGRQGREGGRVCARAREIYWSCVHRVGVFHGSRAAGRDGNGTEKGALASSCLLASYAQPKFFKKICGKTNNFTIKAWFYIWFWVLSS